MATTLERIKALELQLKRGAAELDRLKELHRQEELCARRRKEMELALAKMREEAAADGLVLSWTITTGAAPAPKPVAKPPTEWQRFLELVKSSVGAMEEIKFPAGHAEPLANVLKRKYGMGLTASAIQEKALLYYSAIFPDEVVIEGDLDEDAFTFFAALEGGEEA
jgi:hypothetical protein